MEWSSSGFLAVNRRENGLDWELDVDFADPNDSNVRLAALVALDLYYAEYLTLPGCYPCEPSVKWFPSTNLCASDVNNMGWNASQALCGPLSVKRRVASLTPPSPKTLRPASGSSSVEREGCIAGLWELTGKWRPQGEWAGSQPESQWLQRSRQPWELGGAGLPQNEIYWEKATPEGILSVGWKVGGTRLCFMELETASSNQRWPWLWVLAFVTVKCHCPHIKLSSVMFISDCSGLIQIKVPWKINQCFWGMEVFTPKPISSRTSVRTRSPVCVTARIYFSSEIIPKGKWAKSCVVEGVPGHYALKSWDCSLLISLLIWGFWMEEPGAEISSLLHFEVKIPLRFQKCSGFVCLLACFNCHKE